MKQWESILLIGVAVGVAIILVEGYKFQQKLAKFGF